MLEMPFYFSCLLTRTGKALSHIEVCFIWIPIVLCVLIGALTYFYKLDAMRGEMTRELEKRRTAA